MPDSPLTLPERRYPARPPFVEHGNRAVVVFVTVCTRSRARVLATGTAHELLLDAWRDADAWAVGRYVILPDHIHLFASPAVHDAPSVRRWTTYWKSLAKRAWPDRTDRPLWQRSLWARQLRRGESYEEKWEYVRANPVRHGLVASADDWPFQGEISVLRWHD